MPAFPRTILPRESTWPDVPSHLRSIGWGGKSQMRSTAQAGRVWSEFYGPYHSSDTTFQAWLAQVQEFYRAGTVFDIDHRSKRTLLGVGGGTPLVNGAGQTGSSLNTDGWTASTTNVLRAGDIIRIAGLNVIYELTANASSNGSGQATLSISPPIFVGHSPADNAALTINNPAGSVLFRATIERMVVPRCGPDEFYGDMEITFREQP